IQLHGSDHTEARVPGTVTIPADMAFTTFVIDVVDDQFVDGTQTVTITGQAAGLLPVASELAVLDNDELHALDDILLFEEDTRTFKLATNSGEAFTWFQSNPLPETPSGFDSLVGDFDGDGDLDGAVRNRDTFVINVFTNLGDGTLAPPRSRGSVGGAGTPGFFQVGDYDGDSHEELLWLYTEDTNSNDGIDVTGTIFIKDLSTGATFFVVKANPEYDAFITGDFNGDGFDDLAGLFDNLAGTRTNIIPFFSVASNNPLLPRRLRPLVTEPVLGQFGLSVVNDGLGSFQAADLNGDGKDDLIAVTSAGNSPGQVLHATTTGNFAGDGVLFAGVRRFIGSNRGPLLDPVEYSGPILAGLFSDDTLADLFSLKATGDLTVAVSQLNTSFLNPVVLPSAPVTFLSGAGFAYPVIGDFNGDGYDDIALLGSHATVYMSLGGMGEFTGGLDFGPIIGGGTGSVAAIRIS
ncbi:MAG: hypothetical protein KDA80_23685, partial [Planctomycetaceae bacterium]|nr:hypothetical protein [Planctomycetaceae bacterium]